VCKTEADVVVPVSIIASSVQISFYERPTVKPDVKRV